MTAKYKSVILVCMDIWTGYYIIFKFSIETLWDVFIFKFQNEYKAEISFKSVNFRYPNRITVPVLQGLTFTVSPGQTLALVGSSGCGKSTSIQLIERFYDAEDGSVVSAWHLCVFIAMFD